MGSKHKLEHLTEGLQIQLRDNRVEELEKRLKSMEDLMKRSGSDQHSVSNSIEFGNNPSSPEVPILSYQSEVSASDSSSSWDPASTVGGENSQALDLGFLLSEG